MNKLLQIAVIIPAFNEEKSVVKVIADIPKNWKTEIIVVNNASTDLTAEVAKTAGATVLTENNKGYGYACLKGIDYCKSKITAPDFVVFMDADYSDYPEQMIEMIELMQNHNADLIIGSRALGIKEKGSMTPQQIFGNWLATRLIKLFYGVRYTDLGPFRAVKWDKLLLIDMQDKTYGWTVEMQLKAAKLKLKTMEMPVKYRKRIGVSKVSGTVKGTVLAGYKIITTIFKYL